MKNNNKDYSGYVFLGAIFLGVSLPALGLQYSLIRKHENYLASLEKTIGNVYTAHVFGGIDVGPAYSGPEVQYIGMPNEKTFGLRPVHAVSTTFYSADTKEILFFPYRFEVMGVNPQRITLKYLGE